MKRSPALPLIIGCLALWGFYLWRAAPTITIGDAAELSAVGGTLGIAHSPGYPLYSLLTRLGCRLIPFSEVAYQTNLQSAFWTAVGVGMIALCLIELTGSLGVALLTGLLIACGPLWMGQAVVTEVFGLNSFLAAFLLYLALRPSLTKAYVSAYVLGIGLGNNHTLILWVPALVIAFWPVIRERPLKISLCLIGFGSLGLSLYFFIPLRAHRFPLMNWEEPATWERFWKLFTRARYGSFQLAQGTVPQITWEGIIAQGRYAAAVCWQNFGPWSLAILVGLSAGILRRSERRLPAWFLTAAFLVSGPLFLVWTNLAVTPRTRGILDRFMYLPLVPASVLLGMGLNEAAGWLQKWHVPAVYVLSILGLAGLLWTRAQAMPYERSNFYVWDVGRDLLRNAPPRTLLFADRADEAEFALAYLQRAEGRRPDVQFYDCNAGVSTSLYGPGFYDVWGPRRLALRTIEERKRIAAWDGPVFYATHDSRMIPIVRVQEGLLFAVPRRSDSRRSVPWAQIHVFRRPHPVPGRPVSWDRGMYADYLYLLSRDAMQSKNMAQGLELYRGADLHASH